MQPHMDVHAQQQQSPFRAQLGEFMLESDFSYLHSILPPLGLHGGGEMDGGSYAGFGGLEEF